MLSIDTNLLVYALNRGCPEHQAARSFLDALAQDDRVAICELVLVELYVLLRNPVVFAAPCSAEDAVARIRPFRAHPRWQLIDYPGTADRLMDRLWREVARPSFSRRRIFDVRLALTLRHHRVTRFATANVKDFQGLGFPQVFNPLTDTPG